MNAAALFPAHELHPLRRQRGDPDDDQPGLRARIVHELEFIHTPSARA